MSFKRVCYTCGSEYEYCPTCGRFASYPKWMTMWDKEECKDIFNILSAYGMKQVGKEAVRDVLDRYKVTDYSKYSKDIATQLNELFPKKEKVAKEAAQA